PPREKEEQSGQPDGEHLADGLQEMKRWRLPPGAERRAARGLVTERAVIELAEAAVGKQGERDDRRRGEEGDREEDQRTGPALPMAGGEQRRQDERAELGETRQRGHRPASRRRSQHEQAADDQERNQAVVEARPERIERERKGEPGVGEGDTEGLPLGPRSDPTPEAEQRQRGEQLEAKRGSPRGRDVIPPA